MVELERVQRLHPRQPCFMQHPGDGAAFALLHLSRWHRFEVAHMGLALPCGFVGEACELAADRRQAQRLAVLPDGLVLQVAHHAVPAQGLDKSSTS